MTGLDDPPSIDDVRAARAAVRQAADRTERAALSRTQPRKVERDAAEAAGAEAGAVAGSRVARRIGLVALLAALILPSLVSLAAYSTATDTAGTVRAALDRLDAANTTLAARGQPPVPAPVNADPAEAVAAAVLAQVLAQLPPTPDADQVATAIQPAVTANVLGPTMAQLSQLVAAYYQQTPQIPGPGPSPADIDAAVARDRATNPPAPGRDGSDGDRGAEGDEGPAGPGGRSILTGPEPVRVDGVCVWRSTYSTVPVEQTYAAGDAACPGTGPIDPPPPSVDPGTPGGAILPALLNLVRWD